MQATPPISPKEFDECGFAIIEPIQFGEVLDQLRLAANELLKGAPAAGLRSPLNRSAALGAFSESKWIRELVEPYFGQGNAARDPCQFFITRSILFDKSPDANWDVAWHQDTTICVEARHDVPGFGPWSMKDGRPHVRPPASVLERMLTVRIHLDDCDAANGALHVVPGSHRLGILNESKIAEKTRTADVHVCEVPAGGLMIMRPLLLHASKRATSPQRRRVLHLEFAMDDLPGGLVWAREPRPN